MAVAAEGSGLRVFHILKIFEIIGRTKKKNPWKTDDFLLLYRGLSVQRSTLA